MPAVVDSKETPPCVTPCRRTGRDIFDLSLPVTVQVEPLAIYLSPHRLRRTHSTVAEQLHTDLSSQHPPASKTHRNPLSQPIEVYLQHTDTGHHSVTGHKHPVYKSTSSRGAESTEASPLTNRRLRSDANIKHLYLLDAGNLTHTHEAEDVVGVSVRHLDLLLCVTTQSGCQFSL